MSLWQRAVHISGLNDDVTSSDIELHFGDVGTIDNVFILRHEITDRRTGSAYILFADAGMATSAITEKSGSELNGCKLTLKESDEGHELKLAGLLKGKLSGLEEVKEKVSALGQDDLMQLLQSVLSQNPTVLTNLTPPGAASLPVQQDVQSMNGPPHPPVHNVTHPMHVSPPVHNVTQTTGMHVLPPVHNVPQTMHVPPPPPPGLGFQSHGVKIPQFSGDGAKGELTYPQWKYEVKCLILEGQKPAVITHAIRRSLRGTAAEVMRNLGDSPSVDEVLSKFDVTFGNVLSIEQLFQEFYSTKQKDGESIPIWSCRLEDIITQLREQGCIGPDSGKDMVRSKFWSGLRYEEVKAASRHVFDSGTCYEALYKYVRTVHEQFVASHPVQHKGSVKGTVVQQQTDSSGLKELMAKISTVENTVKDLGSTVKLLEESVRSLSVSQPVVSVTRPPPSPQKTSKPRRSQIICHRCGRCGHHKKKCYAKIHINGTPLNPKAPSEMDGT